MGASLKTGSTQYDGVECAAVKTASRRLTNWLREAAYPLWSTRGIDWVRGGFQEGLTLSGEPTDDARRARVQARQIYAFSQAPAFGWKGDARGAVTQGMSYLLHRFRRPDALFRTLVSADGSPVDDRALLYDQTFILLCLATAGPVTGKSFDLIGEAEQLRQALYRYLKRPGPGFESGLPHGPTLLANPHMHLLEAALAWLDVDGGSEWRVLADEIGELALARMIESSTGFLHENFDLTWKPTRDTAGRLVEPGHHFEWAWLLMRWGQCRADVREAALRLIEIAEMHGVHKGVAVNVLVNDKSIHDGSARLWPQTERLKAAALATRLFGDARYWRMTVDAAVGLLRYLDTDVPGLWYDRMTPAGEFIRETVPAGNLYHIVGAVHEVTSLVRSIGARE